MRQLLDEECTLDLTYLVSSRASFPLVGLIGLAGCYVTCIILDKEPRELLAELAGRIQYSTAGHSQSIVTAAAIVSP